MGIISFHEHPIIRPKESQRNPGNLAVFGIKNARRTASQDELVFGSRIGKLLSVGVASGLRDGHLLSGDYVVDFSWR